MIEIRNRSTLAVAAGSVLLLLAAVVGFAGKGDAAGQAAPSNQSPPAVSGTAEEGKTLTTTNGSWTGTDPITYAYAWRRCDSDGGSCSTIGGATQKTYVLKGVDVGNTLRSRVTATNTDGSNSATSVPTAVVKAAPKPPSTNGCAGNAPIPVASISLPEQLTVDQQQITPGVVGRSTSSITLRFHVSCSGKSVQGALVYATAVPFNQFTNSAEQATGADGNAQLTMSQLSGFPAARNQQLLAVFVRARKSGENVLGGVSTRRLVSFPVDLRR
jgi:hypothetical protein